MSTYLELLTDLAAATESLDGALARAERDAEGERRRAEAELTAWNRSLSAVRARLDDLEGRARAAGIGPPSAPEHPVRLGRDPVDHAAQLVDRLEEAITRVEYTQTALRAERESDAAARQARARAEREEAATREARRAEAWTRAAAGDRTFGALLAVAFALGLAAAVSTGLGGLAAVVVASLGLVVASAKLPSTVTARIAVRGGERRPPLPDRPAELRARGRAVIGLLGATAAAFGTACGGAIASDAGAVAAGAVIGLAASAALLWVVHRPSPIPQDINEETT